jgi:hypothetical protein
LAAQIITFSELQKRFPSRNIALYGNVVVVPKSEFQMDWDHVLGAEGCRITYLDVDDRPSVLVSLQKSVTVKEKRKRKLRLGSWTPGQTELLLKEFPKTKGTARVRGQALVPLFPGHSVMSIYQQFWKLTRKSVHASRDEEKVESHEEKVPQEPLEARAERVFSFASVVKPLEEILATLKKFNAESSVCFECYCPSCRQSRSVEDENVWKCCPVCGGPLIVWNVEVGGAESELS